MSDTVLPEWVSELRDLTGYVDDLTDIARYVDTLTDFASDPVEFILGTVLTFLVGIVLRAGEFLIETVDSVWSPLVSVPSIVLSPLFAGGATIAVAIESVLMTINSAIVTVAAAAGPAAPIVIVVTWAVVAIAATRAINYALTVIKWI